MRKCLAIHIDEGNSAACEAVPYCYVDGSKCNYIQALERIIYAYMISLYTYFSATLIALLHFCNMNRWIRARYVNTIVRSLFSVPLALCRPAYRRQMLWAVRSNHWTLCDTCCLVLMTLPRIGLAVYWIYLIETYDVASVVGLSFIYVCVLTAKDIIMGLVDLRTALTKQCCPKRVLEEEKHWPRFSLGAALFHLNDEDAFPNREGEPYDFIQQQPFFQPYPPQLVSTVYPLPPPPPPRMYYYVQQQPPPTTTLRTYVPFVSQTFVPSQVPPAFVIMRRP